MSTYIITGKAKADSVQTPFGTWYGVIEIPVFKVEAESETEAAALAKEIIDPLETTEVNATAVEEVPDASSFHDRLDVQLRALLSEGAVLTPYEHYCEAERLLAEAEKLSDSFAARVHTRAKVHAVLATAVIPERKGL